MFTLYRPDGRSPLERIQHTDFSDLWAGAEAMAALRGELHRLDFGGAAAVRAAIRAVESAPLADKPIVAARLQALCARLFAPPLALALAA
jgi:hypothetical protein